MWKQIWMTSLALGMMILVGCKEKPAPSQEPNNNKPADDDEKQDLLSLMKRMEKAPAPETETPEVLALVKANNWNLFRDVRMFDGKPMLFLAVADKKDSSKDVDLENKDYEILAKIKATQFLDLSKCKPTDEQLKILSTNQTLQCLFIEGAAISDKGLSHVAAMKQLDYVIIFSADQITDAGIQELAKLPKLQHLFLFGGGQSGRFAEAFVGHPSFNRLTMTDAKNLDDEGCRTIAKLKNLQALELSCGFGDERKMSAAGVTAIVDGGLPLQFKFPEEFIDDTLFKKLVEKGWYHGPSPKGASTKRPATANDVKYISLSNTKVTDAGIAALKAFPNLEDLSVSETAITDEGLKTLADLKKLRSLGTNRTKITFTGILAFGERPWKELSCIGMELTDADAKKLAGIATLERLDLDKTQITDVGFNALLALPKLSSISVSGTKVTAEAIIKAKAQYPKMFIASGGL